MALFSERYYANKNGTGAAKASSASKKRKGSFSERYYADKYSKSIGFDTFDNDLKTTNDLLSNIYQNWQDTDSMTANREKVSSMRNRLNDLYSYSKFSGQDTEEIKKVLDAYDSAIKEWDSLTEYYGGFKSGDAYANYMKEQAEKEALANKSAFDEYRYLLEDEDFMKNATYDAAKKNVSFWDNLTGKSELAEVRNETRDGWLGDVQRTLQAVLPNDSAKYGYLTDEELKVYYAYLANDDKKGAEDFLDKMSKELNKRMTDTRTEDIKDLAQSNGVWGTISSVGSLGMNFLGGISSVVGDVKNLITGEEVDANDYSHFLSNMGDAAREGASEDIRENSKVLSFLYDTGMSIADSVLNVAALGGGAVANLATKAYSSKMKEMQDMGASQTEMLLTSALSGGIEALTEKFSVGNLLKPKGITTLKSFIGETFKQAGVEASEEAVSSVLNQTVDALNGFALNGTSSIKTSYEDYLLRGYTEEEAQKEVAKEGLTDVLLSAIGGAISGGAMGGISNTTEGIGNYNVGKFVSNNNRLGELTDLATEVGPIGKGKNAVDYAQQLQNSPNKATIGYAYKNVAEEANRQASELDRSETKELIMRRLVEMGESGETAVDMAEAIISQREGKATASQRKMIKESGIAADAVKELGEGADWTTKSTEGLRKAQGLRDKLKSISTMRDASVVKAEQRASEMNVADTTTDIATGNEIDIEGVRYDENGEAILQTSEGERTLSEVTLTSNNAIAIAYAQDMDRAAADTFVSLYDGKQDFEQYKDSFELVWNYGKDGYGSDSVLSHLGNLTESQALAVYKAGMTSEVAKAQKAVNAIKKQYQGFSAVGNYDDSIIDYKGVDSSKVNFNDLSDNQKQNLVVAQTIAKGLGLNVKLFSSKHGENKANGYYDSKTNTIGIDIYAEQKGGSLHNGITTAMSHELTHWMKDKSPKLYNEMRELVMNGLSKASGVSGDVLAGIEAYRLDSRHKGVEHSDSAAIDELIARACEDMLSNSKVAKNLLENMSAETKASFVDKVKEFLSKIKEAISSIMGRFDSESREAKLLREMDGMADKMAELWDAMLEDSVETNDALKTAEVTVEYEMAASDKQLSERVGVGFDADTESVYPKQFSLKTWTESEYQQNVDEAVEDISKKLKVSKKKARQYIDNINSIAKMIADDRQRLDYDSNVDESATSLKENSEYKWTVDMSTLCAKRLLFTGTFDSIQKKLMNTALTSEDIVRIRKMMEDRGYTVACGICYVESTRREMGPITADFIKQYKEAQKNGTAIHRINSEGKSVELKEKGTKRNFFPEEGYTPTLADLNTTDIDLVKRDHPDVYGAYLSFMNARGQAKPKLLETRTEYKGEILKHFKSKSAVKSRNDAGGLRVQSFSDFEVAHLIDMMQIAMDMSRVGLYSQAYTKVPAFADVFGGTGMKINLSLIAKGDGLDADGNLIFDDVEGIDHKEAFRLREKWSENVGTILVGKNDAHIIKAMADPRIDYIIPFHKSSWKESLYSALGLTGYGDYTDTQNEKALDKGRKIKNFAPSEYWDYSKSGDENAQTYLEMCKADGRIPKFPQFAHYEGYWKLLIDFKMYDNNGVGVPQRAVRPDFDMKAAEKILNEYEGGHRSFPVAEDVVDDFVAEYKGEHPGVQYSDRNDDSWLDALDIDDLLDDITGYFFKDTEKKGRAPRRVDEVNKRLKAIGLSFNGTKSLSWTDERIEKYLGGGWYGSSNPDYAQAYIAYVAPQQFLNLTVGGKNTTLDMIENESKEYGDLDIAKLGESNPLSLFIEEGKNAAKVVGHEGRHRMYLLGKAGFEKVPVLLFDYRTKYDKTAKESLKLTAQRFNDTDFISKMRDVVLSDLVPFSNGNKDLIIKKFGSGAEADIQYSDKTEPIAEEDYKNMIKHFGTTGSFNVSGYMLTDGKMLDFSGKHWGDTTSRTRQVDHRDVSEVLPDENNGIDSMVRMISNGNIRLMPENGGINLAVAPTKNQRTVLRRYIEYFKGEIVVDVDEVGGDTVESFRYERGTSADRVLRDIDNYFKGGRQSDLMKFHMQYSDKAEYSYDSLIAKGEDGSIPVAKLSTALPRKADGKYSRNNVVMNALNSLEKLSGNVRIAHNDDSDIDIVVNRNSLEHSLRSEDSAIVAQGIKDILRHAIKVNEMEPRSNAKSSSVYLGYGMDENGQDYIARLIVVEKDGRGVLEDYNLLYAANAKKIEAVSSTTIGNGIASPTASTIKISSLLHHVKDNFLFRDSVSRDVLDKLGVSRVDTKFSEGLIYSDKGSDGEELGSYYKTLARKLERENEYLKTRHENYKARIEKSRRIEQITKKASRMNDLLKKNSKDYHVPEILKEPLEAVLSAIDFSSKTLLKKGEPTGKDIKLAQAFSNLQDVLTSIDKAQITDNDIDGIYGHFDMPEGFVEYVMDVKNSINSTIGKMDGEPIVLNRLTKAELDMVYDILTVLNKSIRQMDMALSSAKSMRISEISNSTKGYLDSIQKLGNEQPLMQKMKGFLGWENVLPVYAMSRFGEGGDTIMELLQNGWDKLAFNVNRVIKFSEDTYTKKQLKEWEGNTKTFTVSNGNKRKEITLTDSQIMSLYCLSKREQAKGHLFGKGITIGSYETKDKKIKKVTHEDSTLLTEKELKNIISSLSQEQIQVANQLQEFMNTVCAEWGNQVTMVRFGIKSFGEKDYFPIQSDSNVIESSPNEKNNSLFRLLNLSFTKSLTKNANNPIMVNSIFDVFANHSSDMAKYNALALPVLDAYKWYSAKGSTKDKNGKITDVWSLRKSMDNAYGKSAQSYIRRLLEDMNGQSSGGQDIAEGWSRKLMSNYKVASVAANLRVAILQPTSYVRARLVLGNKYLAAALNTSPSKVKESVEKAKETCGIALWKSMGFYDTNISKGVTDKIKHNDTVMDEIKDKSMILTEKADEITWGFLYRACLLEQKDKGLTGDELEKATASRLREVIYKTQVVDSTLTRTQLMRSKSGWSQMLTSFMSEPSVSWSILSDAAFKWLVDARGGNHKRAFAKHGKAMKDAAMTYLITATTAAIMGALPDMLRDNDDDETMLEKFTVSALDNALSDVTGLLPIVRDVFNAMKGYESTRMDQEVFSTMVSAYKKLTDGEFTYKDVYYTARAISQATGVPISNVIREFTTMWNNTVGNIYPNNKLK